MLIGSFIEELLQVGRIQQMIVRHRNKQNMIFCAMLVIAIFLLIYKWFIKGK